MYFLAILHNIIRIICKEAKNLNIYTEFHFHSFVYIDNMIIFKITFDFYKFRVLLASQNRGRSGKVIHEENARRVPERAKGQSLDGVSRVHLSMQRVRA